VPQQWIAWAYLPIHVVCYALATACISILIGPLYPIAVTLFYYDQRIRREGYDIERLMETAGLTAPQTPPAGEKTAAPQEAEA
jgi:hypothetical protein